MIESCDEPREYGLPDKARYCVSEVAAALAVVLGVTNNAATIRIHRAIYSGRLAAKDYLGAKRIPRAEVLKLLQGDDCEYC